MDVVKILRENEQKDLLRFVTAGSVDDGKSTLIGRLLYESKGIYEDQLAAVEAASGRRGSAQGEMDLSLLTDGLKAEREQGITIDVAYRYFSTPKRKFIIADTPGHEQYTRNTATGASTANLAIILVDAVHGVVTQSKRHAFIATLLGIPHLLIAVNKMDLVDYSREVFEEIRDELSEFAARLRAPDLVFVPVSALKGDNVVTPSTNMPWYRGTTLLNHLENVHVVSDRNFIDMRFPVQYVSRPDPNFRGYSGTVASGLMRPGDEVVVLPSGRQTRIDRILNVEGEEIERAFPPMPATVVLTDDVDVSRGDMLCHVNNVPTVGRTLEAMIVWMSEEPMELGKTYTVKHTTRQSPGQVAAVRYRINVNTLHREQTDSLDLNEIGRCVVELGRPVLHDAYTQNRNTGAFVLIDRVTHNTVAAGMILDRERSDTAQPERVADKPRSEHVAARGSRIERARRAGRLGQEPFTVWLTGLTGSGKTTVAYELEERLFDEGLVGTVLDGENARLTFNKDLGFTADERGENVRRAAEVARVIDQAGLFSICAFLTPYEASRQRVREVLGDQKMMMVYLSAPQEVCRWRRPDVYEQADAGEIQTFTGVTAPFEEPPEADLTIPTHELEVSESVDRIVAALRERGWLG